MFIFLLYVGWGSTYTIITTHQTIGVKDTLKNGAIIFFAILLFIIIFKDYLKARPYFKKGYSYFETLEQIRQEKVDAFLKECEVEEKQFEGMVEAMKANKNKNKDKNKSEKE